MALETLIFTIGNDHEFSTHVLVQIFWWKRQRGVCWKDQSSCFLISNSEAVFLALFHSSILPARLLGISLKPSARLEACTEYWLETTIKDTAYYHKVMWCSCWLVLFLFTKPLPDSCPGAPKKATQSITYPFFLNTDEACPSRGNEPSDQSSFTSDIFKEIGRLARHR